MTMSVNLCNLTHSNLNTTETRNTIHWRHTFFAVFMLMKRVQIGQTPHPHPHFSVNLDVYSITACSTSRDYVANEPDTKRQSRCPSNRKHLLAAMAVVEGVPSVIACSVFPTILPRLTPFSSIPCATAIQLVMTSRTDLAIRPTCSLYRVAGVHSLPCSNIFPFQLAGIYIHRPATASQLISRVGHRASPVKYLFSPRTWQRNPESRVTWSPDGSTQHYAVYRQYVEIHQLYVNYERTLHRYVYI